MISSLYADVIHVLKPVKKQLNNC